MPTWSGSPIITGGLKPAGRSHPGPRPGPLLPRLARYLPAQLPPPGSQGGDDPGAPQAGRGRRRGALRHGHAYSPRGLPAHLGGAVPPSRRLPPRRRTLLARGHRQGKGQKPPAFSLWLKSIGTWSGSSCSRALTIAMIKSCMTGSWPGTPRRCGATSGLIWLIRTSWRGFWKTTTSPGPPMIFRFRTPGRGNPHLPHSRPALLSRGPV